MTAQYKEKKNSNMFAVVVLMVIAGAIAILGLGFGVYAAINNVNFSVLRAQVPGILFAAVVAYLGVRYFFSAVRLAKKVRGQQFEWKNFRKTVNAK